MTSWLGELDDDDFLAPVLGDDHSATAEPDPDSPQLIEEIAAPPAPIVEAEIEQVDDEDWTPLLGFPDEAGAVRVWATEDGELDRVRVSLNWREKLRESSLERSFFVCFTLVNGYYPPETWIGDPPPLEREPSSRPLTWALLTRVTREHSELDARLNELGEPEPSHWVGTPVSGSDFEDGVIVQLDIHGRAVSVRFDQTWLDTPVTSGEIARGVMAAYRRARKKHVPPTIEYSEAALLLRRRRQITQQVLSAMNHGVDV